MVPPSSILMYMVLRRTRPALTLSQNSGNDEEFGDVEEHKVKSLNVNTVFANEEVADKDEHLRV